MHAELVFDGEYLNIPAAMGVPNETQMQGQVLEQLGELACRVCYDSLGTNPKTGKPNGRPSEQLHKHILEVINLSVYEHIWLTIRFQNKAERPSILPLLLGVVTNRRGMRVDIDPPNGIDFTINLRAILEWDFYTEEANRGLQMDVHSSCLANEVGDLLNQYGNTICPMIVKRKPMIPFHWLNECTSEVLPYHQLSMKQTPITMYLEGSRGFSHEMVRHRFGMSQRSTRYVDESESDYIEHPLITKYILDESLNSDAEINADRASLLAFSHESKAADRLSYKATVVALENYLTKQGLDKTSARKQARGAARGYLGNALSTALIYTATAYEWRWIIGNRLHPAADAEIREIAYGMLRECQKSQYGRFFEDLETKPSPDGIGHILSEILPESQRRSNIILGK